MNKLLKVITYIAIITLLVPTFPAQIFADEHTNFSEPDERVLLIPENLDEEVLLYSPDDGSKVIANVSDMSIGLLISEDEHQSVVSLDLEYFELLDESYDIDLLYDVENDTYHFLVDNEDIIKESESDMDFDKILDEQNDSSDDESEEETPDIEEDINDELEDDDIINDDEDADTTIDDQNSTDDEPQELPDNESSSEDEEFNEDIAIEENASEELDDEIEDEVDEVIEEESLDEEVTDEDATAEDTQVNTFSAQTFSATPRINFSSLKSVEAIALKQPTKVYTSTSTSSKVLKSYSQGQILKIRKYTNSWYAARVFINGKAQWGYIAAADADEVIAEKRINGQSNVQSAKVYTSPSRNSNVLKSYAKGKIVIYRTYTSQWHTAQVYINGKPVKGYVHANDVIPQPTYKAIAALPTVSVYKSMSKSSTKLKTYKEGHVITYRKNNNNWHYATVYINGKQTSGYIYANDLEDLTNNQVSMQKYGLKSPTNVYSSPSSTATTLKSYKQGHLLKFHTYTDSWYRTTVYINGKATTGYIHKNDVGNVKPSSVKKYQGIAAKSKTNVYVNTSTSSNVLKSYTVGSFLKFSSYSSDWYKATVYINGKATTGYIHKNDVVVTNNKSIVLDAGHGGSDPGATRNGLQEKILTLDITKRVQSLLVSKGYKVTMTRTDDRYVDLKERTNLANRLNADIMVSIHINSGGGTGIETWKMNAGPNPGKSTILATELQNGMINTTKAYNRGIKDGNLHINRESKMPSSLVEIGFIDHPLDSVLLKQNAFKQNAAQGIANGIDSYFMIYR